MRAEGERAEAMGRDSQALVQPLAARYMILHLLVLLGYRPHRNVA